MIRFLSRALLQGPQTEALERLPAVVTQLWRGFSAQALPAQYQEHPSPQKVLQELNKIDKQLRKSSHRNGSKRLQLSTSVFQVPVPEHDIEPGLMSIDVCLRPSTGSTPAKWLRSTNRVTGRVSSLPDNRKLMMHMDVRDADRLVRQYGENGCQSRIVQLRVVDPDSPDKQLAVIRAKPQQVRRNASSLKIQNLEFLFCPQHRIVRVAVPIRLVNADASVGVRKGGWLMTLKRSVLYKCRGSSVPPYVEIDVKGLEIDQAVRVRDLPIPPGTILPPQDFDEIVVKCTTEAGDELAVR